MYLNLTELGNLRKDFGLKQYDICRYIGVSDVAYRTWEQKVRQPNDVNFYNLRQIFEILESHRLEITDRQKALDILDKEFERYEEDK